MFGLPFPTYLGWFLSPGIMIFTLCLSIGPYANYNKKEAAKKHEKEKNGK